MILTWMGNSDCDVIDPCSDIDPTTQDDACSSAHATNPTTNSRNSRKTQVKPSDSLNGTHGIV